jgi:CDP-diacylglycerol--glycerol-3-phosphate 3-phosphatidyltransferase
LTTAAAPASVWNIANALTALRLLLVPVFGWLLFAEGGESTAWRVAAAVAFFVAGATDLLDGDIARRRGLVTDLGKIADPIADKALTGTALVGLSLLGELPWWVTAVVLVREIGITVLRFVIIRHGVLPAGRGGKAKTAVQGLAILLYLLPLSGTAHLVAVVVMAFAVLLTVATGADYVAQAYRMRSTSERTRLRRAGNAVPSARTGDDVDEVGGVTAGQGGEG